MHISQAGLDLIYSFEGKHRALGDGRYIAYRCPAGVWTIYAGCTKGVHEGMIVTEAGGEAMFRAEIAKFEDAVTRLVTVPINQHQYDALVSFAYNCGEGALAKSSVLKLLNAGDANGAARAFAVWNKARAGGQGRPLAVMPGLVRRRAAEAALFLRPVDDLAAPAMPQAVEAAVAPTGSRKAAVANAGEKAAVGGGISLFGLQVADAMGYSDKGLALVKAYGVEAVIVSAFVMAIAFAAIRHFQRQDHAEGRYIPSGEM